MITPTHYMLLSAALFIIGVIGVMVRRNIIIIFMSIELILNAVNINLVAFSSQIQARDHPGVLPEQGNRQHRRNESDEVVIVDLVIVDSLIDSNRQ